MIILKRFYNVVKHLHFKIADRGLFGGAKLTTGNRISEFGNKSRRRWEPSLKHELLYSETLGRKIMLRTTPKVLKRMDALGGLDNYILGQRVLESSKALTLKHAMVLKRWKDSLLKEKLAVGYKLNPIRTKL
jgi:large subunit ribosomal protein L28